jgi:hypothetical protein
MEVLVRTNSEEDIKIVRTEMKRLDIKFREPGINIITDKPQSLTRYNITDDKLNQIDLNNVFVFKNIVIDNVSKGVAMLISQNPLKWNR